MKKCPILLIVVSIIAMSFISSNMQLFPSPGLGEAGNLIEYQFNFTTDSNCLDVLLTHTEIVQISGNGIGFVSINISGLNKSIPNYLCVYKDSIPLSNSPYSFSDLIFNSVRVRDLRVEGLANYSGTLYINNGTNIELFNDTDRLGSTNSSLLSVNGTLYLVNSTLFGQIISVNNSAILINDTLNGRITSINNSFILENTTLWNRINSVNSSLLIVNTSALSINNTANIQNLLNSTGIYNQSGLGINSTQMENITITTIKESWLTTFVNSLSSAIYNLFSQNDTTLDNRITNINQTIMDYAINVSINHTQLVFNNWNNTWDNSWVNRFNNTWYNHTLSTIGVLSSNFTAINTTAKLVYTINTTANTQNLIGYVPSRAGASNTFGAERTNSIFSFDSRNINYNASDRNAGLYADFKANTADGLADGGTYHGVLTFRAYGIAGDMSGGYPHQLGLTANNNLWMRIGLTNTTWGDWSQISVNHTNITFNTYNSTWDNNWLTALLSANDTAINNSVKLALAINTTAGLVYGINTTANIGNLYNFTAGTIANTTFKQNFTSFHIGNIYNITVGQIANKTFLQNFTLRTIQSFLNNSNGYFASLGIGHSTPDYLLEIGKVDKALNVSGVLYVNGTSGNVGIGTTSPDYKLQINAGSGLGERIITTGGVAFRLTEGTGFNNVDLNVINNTGDFRIGTGSVYWMSINQSSGYVGIGTTAPVYKLDVLGTLNATSILMGSHNLSLWTTNISLPTAGIGQTYNATSLIFAQMNNNTKTIGVLYNATALLYAQSVNTTNVHQILLNGTNVRFASVNVTGTGYFQYLGSLLERVTTFFVQDIDFTGNINGSGAINTTKNITSAGLNLIGNGTIGRVGKNTTLWIDDSQNLNLILG